MAYAGALPFALTHTVSEGFLTRASAEGEADAA